MHWCKVCGLEMHDQPPCPCRCGWWPAPCCPGCGCGSYAEAHRHAVRDPLTGRFAKADPSRR